MMMIVAIILMKSRKTTGRPAVTIPLDDLQDTQESTTRNLPDVVQESTIVRGHVTPERETTVVDEGGGIETEIVRILVETANTRKKIKRRKRRSAVRVLAVDRDREMKRTNLYRTSLLEKWAKLDRCVPLDQTKSRPSRKKARLFKILLPMAQPIRRQLEII